MKQHLMLMGVFFWKTQKKYIFRWKKPMKNMSL